MPLVWVAETAGILGSAALLVALSVILATYDNKAVFDWKGITLNTVVSVLSTASKASLLYTTSELISQWRWIVFSRTRRPLIDFQRIDAASRGPLGSSEIIWRCRTMSVLSTSFSRRPTMITPIDFCSGWLRVGALVVVLSIAADPLNQQLIQYQQRVVYSEDSSITINRAGRYAKGREIFREGPLYPEITLNPRDISYAVVDADLSMQSSILYGLDQPMENVFQQGSFNCPTGNCTWPSFESLAVCNRCTDVTTRLERFISDATQYVNFTEDIYGADFQDAVFASAVPESGTAFRLPNGLYLDNANGWKYGTAGTVPNGISDPNPIPYGPSAASGAYGAYGALMMTTFGTTNTSETISARDLDTLIWSMSMIRVRPSNATLAWPDLPLSAMECAIFYCVNNYEFKVLNSTLTVTNEPVMDAKRAGNSWDAEELSDEEYYYWISQSERDSLAFQSYLSGLVPRTDLMLFSPNTESRFNISQAAVDSISNYYQSTFASQLYNFNMSDLKEWRANGYYMNSSQISYKPSVMQTLFNSQDLNATFTNLAASMSNAIRAGSDVNFDGVPNVVTGSKGELITFYRVVWPWISLHCSIVVMGFLFLLITIRENKKHGWSVPMWKSSSLAVLSRGQEVAGMFSGLETLGKMEAMAKTSRVTLFDKADEVSSLDHLEFDPLEIET